MLPITRKYYKRGLVLPGMVLLVVYMIDGIIRNTTHDPNYNSDFFLDHTFDWWLFFVVLINTIFILMLSLPICVIDFSTRPKTVRFLWWFILPASWLSYLFFRGVWEGMNGCSEPAFHLIINSLPYLIGLIWGYIRYNHVLTNIIDDKPKIDIITKDDRKIQQPHTPPPQAPMG